MEYFKKFTEKPNHLFGFLFWNCFFGYLPLGLLISIMSLLGKVPFRMNAQEIYGVSGFLIGLLHIVATALILAVISWIPITIGNFIIKRLFGKF